MTTFTKHLSKLTLGLAVAGTMMSSAVTTFAATNYLDFSKQAVQQRILEDQDLTVPQKELLLEEAETNEGKAALKHAATVLANDRNDLSPHKKARLLSIIEFAEESELEFLLEDLTIIRFDH